MYIDAITIVLEEAVKGGPPLSLPIASIEAGDEHSLPNLALRFPHYTYLFMSLISCGHCISVMGAN